MSPFIMLTLKNKGNVRALIAMMWFYYLPGDLFNRFYGNNPEQPHIFCEVYNMIEHVCQHDEMARDEDDGWSRDSTL